MKALLISIFALSAAISSVKADSSIVSRNGTPLTIILQKCESDGNTVIKEIGRGKEVTIPTSTIDQFRGDLERGVVPAICLVVQLETPVKNKNFPEKTIDGSAAIQLRDGSTVEYFFDPQTQRTSFYH